MSMFLIGFRALRDLCYEAKALTSWRPIHSADSHKNFSQALAELLLLVGLIPHVLVLDMNGLEETRLLSSTLLLRRVGLAKKWVYQFGNESVG